MYLDFVFSVLRNFAMLTGVLVFIKNVSWGGELLSIHLRGDDFRQISHKKHETDEWVIRVGSLIIALTALLGLAQETMEHFSHWVHPTKVEFPFAFLAVIGWNTLLSWCLLYFAKRPTFMILSLVSLLALSILVKFAQCA